MRTKSSLALDIISGNAPDPQNSNSWGDFDVGPSKIFTESPLRQSVERRKLVPPVEVGLPVGTDIL